jgi:hypothetical protein
LSKEALECVVHLASVRQSLITNDPDQLLSSGSVSDFEDEESDVASKIHYIATFKELEESHVQYDTIIWILIPLLLVLAWGIGLIMLFCICLLKDIYCERST